MEKPTPAEVRITFKTTRNDDEVQLFIDEAELIAEQCASVVAASATKQKAILRWIAAHLLNFADANGGAVALRVLGSATESFANASMGDFLKSSTYGMQAILLEGTGCLEKIGKQKPILQVL